MAAVSWEPPRHESMLDYLDEHVRTHPEREAAVEGGLRLSYRQLAGAVDALASALAAHGMGAGRVVAFIGPPGAQYLVSLLAAFRAGASWVGLNPKYRSGELAYVIGDARPCLVMVAGGADRRTRDELSGALAAVGDTAPATLMFGPSAAALTDAFDRLEPGLAERHPAQAEILRMQVAVLVYTSGSTGKPKGACLTQANLVENAWWLSRRLADPGGRFLINLPINHAGCIADTTLAAMLQGDTLVFMPSFGAEEAARLIRAEGITSLGQVPTQYQMMHAAGVLTPATLAAVRHLAWGGAAMPRPLIEELAAYVPDLFNSYGLTESTGTVTITPPGASVEQLAMSVGVPFIEGSLRIVDAHGQPVSGESAGEVQIRGPHVFPGYLRNPAATAAALADDGWLRTGDTGHWRPDGSLRLVGRMTEMYKSGGYNIYPREIEAVLEAYPGVVMAAVIGVADPLWGESGCAFVLAAEDSNVDAAGLAEWCREKLAGYKTPKRFEVRAELPLLPIGKIDRKRLPSLLESS